MPQKSTTVRDGVGGRIPSGWHHDQRKNLTDHLYARFIERPAWDYIGASRTEAGRSRDQRNFSITHHGSPGRAFVWTIEDQAWAVREGFFLHRSGFVERVNIIWVDFYRHDNENGSASLSELEKRYFERLPLYGRALRFIKQQDQFGYSGAWDKRVQFYSNQLQWYRFHLADVAPGPLTPREREIKTLLERKREISATGRRHAFASHIKRNYILKGEKN